MDTVVTVVIVLGISLLAVAWLFAGRRRKKRPDGLEHRRLAGREAEVVVATPEKAPETKGADVDPAPSKAQSPAHSLAKDTAPGAMAEAPLLLAQALKPTAKPAAASAPGARAPRSPEQASAMSIAAALVRHDKRDAAKPDEVSTAAEPPMIQSAGGDDLTAIDGIDRGLASELNDLGVRYYDQIVDWSPDYAAWIASRLSTPATSEIRNAWVAQAKSLSERASADRDRASQG